MDNKMYQSANVTIYFNDKMDDGEIIMQSKVRVEENDNEDSYDLYLCHE